MFSKTEQTFRTTQYLGRKIKTCLSGKVFFKTYIRGVNEINTFFTHTTNI